MDDRKFIGMTATEVKATADAAERGQPLQITLYGTGRGKMVAAIAHAYFMCECKLALAPATINAPWLKIDGKPQDYFTWRKMVVEERNSTKATIELIIGGMPPPHLPPWPLVDGKTVYDAQLAGQVSHEFAMMILEMAGLRRG